MQRLYRCLSLVFLFKIISFSLSAQCTTWVSPSDTTGWIDLATAPCALNCTVEELGFEVWADEAYEINNLVAGQNYIFDICQGTGGTAWTASFTVIAPSGNIDAFGLDGGSTCALTFTATESGRYRIVISENGACGVSTNNQTDNGNPRIRCGSGSNSCFPDPVNDECSGALSLTVAPNEGACVPQEFTTSKATQSTTPDSVCSLTWFDDDVWFEFTTGTILNNSIIRSKFDQSTNYSDIFGIGMALYDGCNPMDEPILCFSGGSDELFVPAFLLDENQVYKLRVWGAGTGEESQGSFDLCLFEVTCNAGELADTTPIAVCPNMTTSLALSSGDIGNPDGGSGWSFTPGPDAGGGLLGGFSISGEEAPYVIDAGLNGVLAANSLPPLTGSWFIVHFIYRDTLDPSGSLCDLSENFALVTFVDTVQNITGIIPSGYYQALDTINSDATILSDLEVTYTASQVIALDTGFTADGLFEAVIGDCLILAASGSTPQKSKTMRPSCSNQFIMEEIRGALNEKKPVTEECRNCQEENVGQRYRKSKNK